MSWPFAYDNKRDLPTGLVPGTRRASETAAATLLGLRLVHGETTSLELLLIERAAGSAPLNIIDHLDESESARPSGVTIANDVNRVDLTDLREQLLELLLVSSERQITYVDSHSTFQ